jgi:hypothetical protein
MWEKEEIKLTEGRKEGAARRWNNKEGKYKE